MGKISLPQRFEKRMSVMLGDSYEAFLRSYEQMPRRGLRVNTLKISPEQFERIAPFGIAPIPWISGGYYVEEGASAHPYYHAGLYYLQEPSAMTPAAVLDVNPGDRVLDLCAAPGGKATALGAKLQGKGLLVANDISASRAKALLKNIELFGITNAAVTVTNPAALAERFEGFFDRVLVDAPCSGEGMFRKDEAVIRAWYPEKNDDCARIQRDIILRAADMLREGGKMLYSTCTFSVEENERIIAWLLENRPQMRLIPIAVCDGFAPGLPERIYDKICSAEELKTAQREGASAYLTDEQSAMCVRLWPHLIGGEGHFMALLQKGGDDETGGRRLPGTATGSYLQDKAVTERIRTNRPGSSGKGHGKQKQGEEEIVREFLEKMGFDAYSSIPVFVSDSHAYLMSGLSAGIGKISFIRNGLYLGETRNGRFEPSQSLAMAAPVSSCTLQETSPGFPGRICLAPEDEKLRRYLKGETIFLEEQETAAAGNPKGWVLVCAGSYPLGWGKISAGLLKNKLHPGWRIRE